MDAIFVQFQRMVRSNVGNHEIGFRVDEWSNCFGSSRIVFSKYGLLLESWCYAELKLFGLVMLESGL